MGNKLSIVFLILISMVFLLVNVSAEMCEGTQAPIWNVGSATASKSEVSAGGSVSITVPITNNAQNTAYTCTISIGSSSTSKQVQTGRPEELTLQITAPSYKTTSQKTETVNVNVQCSGIWDRLWPLCDYNVYGELTRSTSYKWPTQAEIIELQQTTQSESAKNAASNAISGANSAINSAQSRINEASKIGADISSATQYINSAQSDYSSANNLFSSGNSALNSKDYSSATSYYQQAQSKANSAQTSAANAKSMVDRIIEEYNKKITEAQNKVSDAKSAVDRANELVKKAEGIISNASVLGLDTASAKANLDTGKAKADLGNNYYNEAKSALDQKNFDSAKSKASSAISYANEGERYATSAYNSLATEVQKLDAVAQALLNANKEVTEMNELYTKMDFIIKSTEKYGLTLTEAKNVVANAKADIDTAEDLFSQAKHRREAGSFQEAAEFAIKARDAASKATNRLDTITQSISTNVQEALDKAYQNMNEEITSVESEVASAEKSYGSDSKSVISAKNSLSEAKTSLSESKTTIESVKVASGLKDVLTQADNSFKKLDAVQDKLNTSLANVSSARRIKLIKITSIAAAIAAAGGGGFLYWKKSKKSKPHKKETKEIFCEECGEKSGSGKFCHNCGAKHK